MAEPRTSWSADFWEGAPDGMLAVDTRGVILRVNTQLEALFGYQRGELVGRPMDMLLPIDLRDAHAVLRDRYVAHPETRRMGGETLTGQRRDGSSFAADISLSTVGGDGDELIVMASVRDATRRVTLEAEVANNLFRQLTDHPDVGFVMRSLDPPACLYVSPGYVKISGYDLMAHPDDPGGSLRRMIVAEDWQSTGAEYWAHASAGRPAEAEFRIRTAAGDIRWIRAATNPVVDLDGVVRRTASTCQDITKQKAADGIRQVADNLAAANAAKNEFLSRMSHELRTPLNAIMGFAQILEMDARTHVQKQTVEYILKAGHSLVELIDDVLDISKIESGRIELTVETVLITEMLTEAVLLMTPVAAAVGVHLTCPPHVLCGPNVTADRRRVRQVLLNLLSNAIKYNRLEGSVDVSYAPGASGYLDVAVSDTGLGINAEYMPRLFTPFDRLGVQAVGIEGSGIGLALSQRLMTAMSGTLRATSERGRGSVFTAALPLAARQPLGVELQARRTLDPAAGPTGAGPAAATRNLLYIEDTRSNIELMEQLVARRPEWRMVSAEEGTLGMELAAADPQPDLVLLDMNLPDIHGIDVLQRLRADPRTQHMRIVVISADGHQTRIQQAMAAGADDYLTKPFAVAQILELLRTHHERTAAVPALTTGTPAHD